MFSSLARGLVTFLSLSAFGVSNALPSVSASVSSLNATGPALLSSGVRAIYIDYKDIDWNTPLTTITQSIDAGYNMIILCFWMQGYVADMAQVWQSVDVSVRQQAAAYAKSKNAVLLVGAGGATESPFGTPGASYGASVGSWAANHQLTGVVFDIENLASGFKGGSLSDSDTVTWLVDATVAARSSLSAVIGSDSVIIAHAPQAPYFGAPNAGMWTGPTGGYTAVEKQATAKDGKGVDYYLTQFYNQGATCYTTYQGLFLNSASDCAVFPGTSVAEIISYGIAGSKIVDGKFVTTADASNGYIEPSALGQLHKKASTDPAVANWHAGVATWLWEGSATSADWIQKAWPFTLDDEANDTDDADVLNTAAGNFNLSTVYAFWWCGDDACLWESAPDLNQPHNSWLFNRGDGRPTPNLVIFSFLSPSLLLSQGVNGVPSGITPSLISSLTSLGVAVQFSIGGIDWVPQWDSACSSSSSCAQLGSVAAEIATKYGVGVEIDYEGSVLGGNDGALLSAFVEAYRGVHPFVDGENVPLESLLTIDVGAGTGYLTDLAKFAAENCNNKRLNWMNAMVSGTPWSGADGQVYWQQHLTGAAWANIPPISGSSLVVADYASHGSTLCKEYNSIFQAEYEWVQAQSVRGMSFWAAGCAALNDCAVSCTGFQNASQIILG